jgi:hypothetical protein
MNALLWKTRYLYVVALLNNTHAYYNFISAATFLRESSTILRNTYFTYFVIIATDSISCEVRAEGEKIVER